jgi:hypothetical protein
MKHLVFTIYDRHLAYRMGNSYGTHPFFDDQPQKVIDYLLKMIQPLSHEIITT